LSGRACEKFGARKIGQMKIRAAAHNKIYWRRPNCPQLPPNGDKETLTFPLARVIAYKKIVDDENLVLSMDAGT